MAKRPFAVCFIAFAPLDAALAVLQEHLVRTEPRRADQPFADALALAGSTKSMNRVGRLASKSGTITSKVAATFDVATSQWMVVRRRRFQAPDATRATDAVSGSSRARTCAPVSFMRLLGAPSFLEEQDAVALCLVRHDND